MCFYKHENGIKFILIFFYYVSLYWFVLGTTIYVVSKKKNNNKEKKNDTILCFDILDFHFTEVLCTLSREKKICQISF